MLRPIRLARALLREAGSRRFGDRPRSTSLTPDGSPAALAVAIRNLGTDDPGRRYRYAFGMNVTMSRQ